MGARLTAALAKELDRRSKEALLGKGVAPRGQGLPGAQVGPSRAIQGPTVVASLVASAGKAIGVSTPSSAIMVWLCLAHSFGAKA